MLTDIGQHGQVLGDLLEGAQNMELGPLSIFNNPIPIPTPPVCVFVSGIFPLSRPITVRREPSYFLLSSFSADGLDTW